MGLRLLQFFGFSFLIAINSYAALPQCLPQDAQPFQFRLSTATSFFLNRAYQRLTKKKYELAIAAAQDGLASSKLNLNASLRANLYLILGRSFLAQKQLALAIESLLAASKVVSWIDPTQVETQLAFSDYFYNSQHFDLALNFLNNASLISDFQPGKRPVSFDLRRGWLIYELGDFRSSKIFFDLVLNNFSSNYHEKSDAYHGLITLFTQTNNFKEALGKIDESKVFFRKFNGQEQLKILNSEFEIYLAQKDFRNAEQIIRYVSSHFEKKILADFNFQFYLNKASQFRTEKKYESALAQYDRALHVKELTRIERKDIQLDIARIYVLENWNERALKIFEQVLTEFSVKDLTYNELYLTSKLLLLTINLNQALFETEMIKNLKVIAEASRVDNNFLLNDLVMRTFIKSYKIFGQKMLSRENKIVGGKSPFLQSRLFYHFYWGYYYLVENKLPEARKEFSEISQDDKALGFAGLENVDSLENNYFAALNNYIKAKRLVGSKWFYFLQHPLVAVHVAIEKKYSVRVLALLVKALQYLMPEYRNVLHSILAYRYYNDGFIDEAEKECLASISVEKNETAAHRDWARLILGLIAHKRNDLEAEEKYYQSAIKIDPTSIHAMTILASFYQGTRRTQEAFELYQKVIEVGNDLNSSGNEHDVDPLNTWLAKSYLESGNILMEKGFRKEAILNFKKALQFGPTESERSALARLSELTSLTK